MYIEAGSIDIQGSNGLWRQQAMYVAARQQAEAYCTRISIIVLSFILSSLPHFNSHAPYESTSRLMFVAA
jgi:hypothetical protein